MVAPTQTYGYAEAGREVGQAEGNHHPSIAPYGLFATSDGAVQIAVGSESLWRRFCELIELDPATAEFATNSDRVGNRADLIRVVENAFGRWNSADLLGALDAAGVPAGRVRTLDQVYEWDQTLSQGLVVEVDHPSLGPVNLPGPPLRFFTPQGEETTRTQHLPPPLLDEHAATVSEWLAASDRG